MVKRAINWAHATPSDCSDAKGDRRAHCPLKLTVSTKNEWPKLAAVGWQSY